MQAAGCTLGYQLKNSEYYTEMRLNAFVPIATPVALQPGVVMLNPYQGLPTGQAGGHEHDQTHQLALMQQQQRQLELQQEARGTAARVAGSFV